MSRPPSPKVSNIRRAICLSILLQAGASLAAEKAVPKNPVKPSSKVVEKAPAKTPDIVEGLIEHEKKSYQDWLDDADEPPAVYLPGSRSGVEVYSPAFRDEESQVLCHDPALPELLEMTGAESDARETVLNLQRLRVREKVGDACLARPGDRVVAVGRGWQEERTLDAFVIQREKPACAEEPPMGLWMTFDHPLPEDPLFVTTDPTVLPKDNLFIPAEQYAVAPAGPEMLGRLKGVVQFPEDFRVTLISVGATDADAIVLFERRNLTPDDDGLPAMVAAVITKDSIQTLWTERVDIRRGTGRFEFLGTLDMDGDGVRELVFSGIHQTCPYTTVFRRAEDGFEPVPLLVRSCRC